MSNDKPKGPSPNELAAMLRAREKRRRPSRLRLLLLLLLLFGTPLALLTWWCWPRPEPPEALVVAFDAVGPPGATVSLAARLEPADETPEGASLQGWPITFLPDRSSPSIDFAVIEGTTDASGAVEGEMELPGKPGLFPYIAEYALGVKRGLLEDRAQLYCWPADASLLVVDADRSLARGGLKAWKTANPLDIPPEKNAVRALSSIARQKPHQIVYLVCAVESATDYRKVRAALQAPPLPGGERFPSGPVLGRSSYETGDEAEALRDQLRRLKASFSGQRIGVTSNRDTAVLFQQAGLKSLLIGRVKSPPRGVIVVEKWQDLAGQL
jgi:hypothetical protein